MSAGGHHSALCVRDFLELLHRAIAFVFKLGTNRHRTFADSGQAEIRSCGGENQESGCFIAGVQAMPDETQQEDRCYQAVSEHVVPVEGKGGDAQVEIGTGQREAGALDEGEEQQE